MLVQFLESIARSSSRRYDSPCTIKRCSSSSPPMYNSIRCLESRSRAPLVSERFARVPYRLSARSTGRMFIGLTLAIISISSMVSFTALYCSGNSAITRPCRRPTSPCSQGAYAATPRSVEVGSASDPLEGIWQDAECRAVSRQGSRFCNADRPLASDWHREAFAIPG
jgi:hypothetical protein